MTSGGVTSAGRGRTRRRGAVDRAATSPALRVAAAVLSVWVLFGGDMPVSGLLFVPIGLAGTATLVFLALRPDASAWRALGWPARAFLIALCVAPLAQLLPLPPAAWHALPGRDLPLAMLAAAGQGDAWRPLTLDVAATARTALVAAWLVGLLLLLLRLSTDELRRLFGLVLVLGLVNVAMGTVQLLTGHRLLDIHDVDWPFLTGLFANKNHTGLFIALTILAGYARLYGADGPGRRHLAIVAALVLVLFAALVATFSRAGLLLGVGALVVAALLAIDEHGGRRARLWTLATLGGGALVVAVGATSDVATRALARFGGVGDDLRWQIWDWSRPLVGSYWPVGGGIGAFPSLFPPAEALAWVKPTYVNHVHNDYIEMLIELGIAAAVLWLLAVAATLVPAWAAWRLRRTPAGRLAMIGATMLALMALHSAMDYPLRRPAIAATTMLALAALLRVRAGESGLRADDGCARRAA